MRRVVLQLVLADETECRKRPALGSSGNEGPKERKMPKLCQLEGVGEPPKVAETP